MSNRTDHSVRWAELTPQEFERRRDAAPIVYLPVGLCEPHGPTTALGLDLIKAEQLCEAAAREVGGIVAPSLGFHIHECGPSAGWLHEQVGEVEPHLSSVGPTAFSHFLLHQLRAMANAGFAAALVVSGHAGAHAADMAQLTEDFALRFEFPCRYLTDFELAAPEYEPDHAGSYELSLLWHLRPDLMKKQGVPDGRNAQASGRLALGATAPQADPELGREIFEHLFFRLGVLAQTFIYNRSTRVRRVRFSEVEELWRELLMRAHEWNCVRPRANQVPVPDSSRWKTEENLFAPP